MPQMSPLPWLTILIFSVLCILSINSFIYFMFKKNKSEKKIIKKLFYYMPW